MPVGMVPERATVDFLGDSNDTRGRVELEAIFNNRWVIRVKK